MSKTLRTVAMVAGVVALAATGFGAVGGAQLLLGNTVQAASLAATVSSVATVATAVATAASLGAQLTAKKPGMLGSVNQVQIGANNPIPYGMGRCYYAGSQQHDVGYGGKVGKTKNPYLTKVFIWSGGGAIDGIEALLMDWQAVSFSGTSALGYYASWLYAHHQLGARPEPAALNGPWGAIPDWSAAHKLSGMAASLLSFRFDRNNKVWANGIPAFGIVARFARVYDPRQDDSFPGGEGDHRFADEDTFTFDRNVALNAITYARGRYAIDPETAEQTIRVNGCGFPFDSFDWPQWVAFANVCEANAWNCDGHVFDGPGLSLWDNLKRICAAGAAVPVISSGLLSVRFQSPKVALDTVTIDDFADGERVVPGTRTYKDRINTIIPKYRSEANKWEYVQSKAVAFESYIALDGEPKEEELSFELVTNKDQAAQLAAYELFGRRELSGISIPCKPRMWRYRLGEALNVVDAESGLNHLCVIAAADKEIASATVTLTFETETNAKHPIALAMTGTAPPPPTLVPPGEADGDSWENGGNTVDPATDLTVTASSTSAAVAWRNPISATFDYVRIYRGTTNVFSAATEIAGPIVGGLGQVQQVTDSVGAGTYYWWVVAFDSEDEASEPTGPVSADVGAFDFTGGALPSGATLARSGAALRTNAAGSLVSEAADIARFDYDRITHALLGLLYEPAAENKVPNNTGAGATVGSTSLPVPWGNTSGHGVTSRTIVAVNTIDGVDYVDIHFQGAATTTGGITLQPDASDTVAAGTQWTSSVYLALVGGTLANVGAITLRHGGETAAQTTVALDGTLRRYRTTRTLTGTSPRMTLRWNYSAVGAAIDFTLRVGLPQRESGATATSPIKTSGTVATRATDALTLNWGSRGVADGAITMRVTFDDGSTQDVAATVAGGNAILSTSLNRTSVRRIIKL